MKHLPKPRRKLARLSCPSGFYQAFAYFLILLKMPELILHDSTPETRDDLPLVPVGRRRAEGIAAWFLRCIPFDAKLIASKGAVNPAEAA
ncbi:hypothetical protein [Streptomyces sp. NPDC003077]|uniref:hypothetical protein n=1 Tax=Streptomyces sp. NPDC003077 TaxID=3154443 RepID=UPI0033A39AB5